MNTLEAEKILKDIETKKSAYWEKRGRKTAMEVFQTALKKIPAYKAYLKKNKSNFRNASWESFITAPFTSKKEYLKKYTLKNLSKSGIAGALTYSATSGSTGEPFYFPRDNHLDWQYSILLQMFLQNISPQYKKQRTLVIVGFGMGVWIGGLITYRGFQFVNERTDSISLITPGVNKKEIFNALRTLAPQYETTILVGYPPFIKDILDESEDEKINLKKLNIKLLFAAEAFTESFRDYLGEKVGVKNVHTETLNIYGTADIGAMAFETPTSILLRRIILKKPELAEKIFGKINRTPTLAQYNPHFVYFETINEEIVLTADSDIPLVRYKVGDHGGTYTFSEIANLLKKEGVDISKEAKKSGVHLSELPFVFVYERTDLSTTLYGLQIYPETIREVLLQKRFQGSLTGKFTLSTVFDKKKNQYLEIHIEQKRGKVMSAIEKQILLKSIVQTLRQSNSEFRELSDFLGKRAHPKIYFWELGNPTYFPVGIKQKWVKKI